MNEQVRNYLIEVAKQKDKMVYYSDVVKDCNLNININTEQGRHELSKVLGEISRFEVKNGRPMLSALAMYKPQGNSNDIYAKDTHGGGFYELAENLGKGNAKKLKADMFAFVEVNNCREYWQNEEHYRKEFLVMSKDDNVKDVPFFTSDELDFFKQWQSKTYDASNEEHQEAGEYLKETIYKKMKYLAKRIQDGLEDFEEESKMYWLEQSQTFKHYAWIKLFRNTDEGKHIYFTFEINAHPDEEALVYKIDCKRNNYNLFSKTNIHLFDSLKLDTKNKDIRWNNLYFDDLLKHNWDTLTNFCLAFITSNKSHYEEIIEVIHGKPIQSEKFQDRLVLQERPSGYEIMPESKRSFQGIDKDFEKEATEKKEIGNAGEELVKQREIAFLNSKKMFEEALRVEIVKDGKGYDVFSFDEDGNEKYIEVKTTTGNVLTPFYLSDNEFDFMKQNVGNYFIYRLYNFDLENNFGEFFILNEDVAIQLIMKPTAYKVVIKKEA
jgi:hypothetical protein